MQDTGQLFISIFSAFARLFRILFFISKAMPINTRVTLIYMTFITCNKAHATSFYYPHYDLRMQKVALVY